MTEKLEWIVQPDHVYGRGDQPENQKHAGETVLLTVEEAGSLAGRVLVLKGKPDKPKNPTVEEVLTLVESGELTAEEALRNELAQDRPRKTLVSALEELING